MSRIQGITQGTPVNSRLPGSFRKNKQEKTAAGNNKSAQLKPLTPKLSEKAKRWSSTTNSDSAVKKPTKKEIRRQAKQLMNKIRKKRPARPPRRKIKQPAAKAVGQKAAGTNLRHGSQGFVPRNTIWIKSTGQPYDASKITYDDDRYIAGTSPHESFNPLSVTGHAKDFWDMVLEEETEVIIDLSSDEDQAQSYYPENDTHYVVGDASLIFLSEKKYSGYKKIFIKVAEKNRRSRLITILHYYAWPEGNLLKGRARKSFLKFVQHTLTITNKLLTVICRSGKGKAGVFIVMQQLFNQIKSEMLTAESLIETLEYLINAGREASDTSFVETENQFVLLVEAGYSMLDLVALNKEAIASREGMRFLDDYI